MAEVQEVSEFITNINRFLRLWKSYDNTNNDPETIKDFKNKYMKTDMIRVLYSNLIKDIDIPVYKFFSYDIDIDKDLQDAIIKEARFRMNKDVFILNSIYKRDQSITDPRLFLQWNISKLVSDVAKKYGGKQNAALVIFTIVFIELLFDPFVRFTTMNRFSLLNPKIVDLNLKYLSKSINDWYTWFMKDVYIGLILTPLKGIRDEIQNNGDYIDNLVLYTDKANSIIRQLSLKKHVLVGRLMLSVIQKYLSSDKDALS